MAKFRYLNPEEYDALDTEQKFAYINAALDHLIARRDASAKLRVDGLELPDLNAAAAAHAQPQQQQQQQQQPPQQDPSAKDAEPSAPDKDKSSLT